MTTTEPIAIGDFTAGRRMIFITVIALAIGAMATFVAAALFALMRLSLAVVVPGVRSAATAAGAATR